jgi:PDZ domain/C2 domain
VFAASVLCTWMASAGCAAVYPAIDTPVRPAPDDVKLDPPPPESLYYLGLKGAVVPQRTRGNEKWDELGDGAPDPYVKLYLDDELLFTTSTEQDTYSPKWSDAPRQNWVVPADGVLKIEMWNANPVNDQVICITELDRLHERAVEGPLLAECEGGASVEIELRPARPKFGLGFRYEIRQGGAAVRDVLEKSPAERAGLTPGELIEAVNGQSTRGMSAGALQTLVNIHARQGIKLTLRQEGGLARDVEVKEGPIYSLPVE